MDAKILVPAQDRPLWSTISRTPQERARATHCNLVRGLIRYFQSDRVADMDCEYGKGSCWLDDQKISCAVLACSDRWELAQVTRFVGN